VLGCGLVVLGLLAAAPAGAGADSFRFPFDNLAVFIYGIGTVPVQDYDQVVTDEPVDLDGVTLNVFPAGDAFCTQVPALENGQTYTIVSTTGGLSGRLSTGSGETLEEGDVFSPLIPFGRGCIQSIGGLELHYHEGGAVQTVTGTVVDGSPIPVTRTSLEPDVPTIETNQLATFTATVSVSSGTTAGTVSFHDPFTDNDAITCGDQHVTATVAEPATATCQSTDSTTDDASRAGWGPSLTATFTPDDPSQVRGSDGPSWVTVRSGTTTTQLGASPGTAPPGTPIDLVATVRPAYVGPFTPSGTVSFSEGGALPGCAAVPLAVDGTAHCSTSFAALGVHHVTARYVAAAPSESWIAADFLGSTSAPASVVASSPPPPPPVGGDPTPHPPTGGRGAPRAPHRAVARHARHPRHARRITCRHHRAHRRAHRARARRCTTIRPRKHTRGAGR
jgi:hypothetical protein